MSHATEARKKAVGWLPGLPHRSYNLLAQVVTMSRFFEGPKFNITDRWGIRILNKKSEIVLGGGKIGKAGTAGNFMAISVMKKIWVSRIKKKQDLLFGVFRTNSVTANLYKTEGGNFKGASVHMTSRGPASKTRASIEKNCQ